MSSDAKAALPALSPARRLAAVTLAAAALTLGAAGCSGGARAPGPTASPGHARPQPVAQCAHVSGPFTDQGGTVRQRDGRAYVPYGITVTGLAHADYQRYLAGDARQILATALFWCANTVRIQVAQDNLVGADGTAGSGRFMEAIRAEVARAQRYKLVVVLCAQTEDVGHQSGPTAATVKFWHALAGIYGRDPQVVFDLFNEPRNDPGTPAQDWRMWQWGGTYRGTRYLGMQQLAEAVRSAGARNLLWVEGPQHAASLAGLAGHLITSYGPLVYSVHHPAGAHNPAAWSRDFGWLATQHIAPVVIGEWSNYAAAKSECWPDAAAAVPAFLHYLAEHEIGMTAWILRPGVMVKSRNLSEPTTITSNWACRDGLDQGAGYLVMTWFRQQNHA